MRVVELLSVTEDVEPTAPIQAKRLPIHSDCKNEIIRRIHAWVVREEINRFGWHPEEFGIHQGYMLALTNLLEVLHEINKEIECD